MAKNQKNKPTEKQAEKVVQHIIADSNYRSRQDIDTWRAALTAAEDFLRPQRGYLYLLYDEIILDNHLQGILRQRIDSILSQAYRLVNEQGEEDAESLALFNTSWFYKFLELSLESRFYGHSLIQLGNVNEAGYDEIILVNRKNVIPEWGKISIRKSDTTNTFSYRDSPFVEWLVEVGEEKNLGLLAKAAPYFLYKKNAGLMWSQYTELFGMPFRTGYTNSRTQQDMQRMATNLKNMGRAAYGVFQDGERIEFNEANKSDAYNVYDKLIERANSELSKLIVGQTMTTDNGSSHSQASVHERVAGNIMESDKRFIQFVVNDLLFPKMIAHGFPLQGLKWEWEASKNIDALWTKVKDILPYANVDMDWIENTFGIPATPKEIATTDTTTPPKGNEKKKSNPQLKLLQELYHTCPACANLMQLTSSNTPHVDSLGIAQHVYKNRRKPEKIHLKTFISTAQVLTNGFAEAFPKETPSDVIAGYKKNLIVFSAAKTFSQMEAMKEHLYDGEKLRSFPEFKKKVIALDKTYNTQYLQAEYNHAIAAGQMARHWDFIQKHKDLYPNLQYQTIQDARVRDNHRILNGLVFPVDDAFWDTHYPPNGWNCRCDVRQRDEDTPLSTTIPNIDTKALPPLFRNNVGKTNIVFDNEKHPYYTGLSDALQKVVHILAENMSNNYTTIKGKKGGELTINPNHTAKEVKENTMYSMPLINNGYKVELPAHIEKDGVKKIDAIINKETADFKELGRIHEVKHFNNAVEKLLKSASNQKVSIAVLYFNKPYTDTYNIEQSLIYTLSNLQRKKSIQKVIIVIDNKRVVEITRTDITANSFSI